MPDRCVAASCNSMRRDSVNLYKVPSDGKIRRQ